MANDSKLSRIDCVKLSLYEYEKIKKNENSKNESLILSYEKKKLCTFNVVNRKCFQFLRLLATTTKK